MTPDESQLDTGGARHASPASLRPDTAALVDSHAHLDFPQFEGRLDAVVERARDAGVTRVISIGTSYEGALKTLEIARRYPCVSAAAGIHPSYIAEGFGLFDDLARLFETSGFVAVGETGLDFYRMHAPEEAQIKAFEAHTDLALAKDLPLVIHVRDAGQSKRAYDSALSVLDALPRMPRGVFHCFSGSQDFAREVVGRGFYVSFAGQVTFKNAEALRAVAATVPADRLLIETDCPYLAPVPHRGKDNEPAFVTHTAQTLAQVRSVPLESLARATTQNAIALFGLK